MIEQHIMQHLTLSYTSQDSNDGPGIWDHVQVICCFITI